MKVEYVTDTSKWEKWQRNYRLGLIVIMPPDEVASRINPLCAKYDPRTYAYCPAHITLCTHTVQTSIRASRRDWETANTKVVGIRRPLRGRRSALMEGHRTRTVPQ
jgi:hypothetical protein